MTTSQSVFQLNKSQNFGYTEQHVFVFALSKFDQVRKDYHEAERQELANARKAIIKKHKRGPGKKAALAELEAGRQKFQEETLQRLMLEGTEQRMGDLPDVVKDAALAIDYAINELGVQPNNVHLFALPEDRQKITELIRDDDYGMDKEPMRQKPDEHIQMRWKPQVKARYSFLYDFCLDETEKAHIEDFGKISYHLPNVDEWETEFKRVCALAEDKSKKILFMQFFAGHGMTFNGEQVLLGNEYDDKSEWYRFLRVEQFVRTMAPYNSNIYFLTTFACCREKYLKKNNDCREETQHRGVSLAEMERNQREQNLQLIKAKKEAEDNHDKEDDVEETADAGLPKARGDGITGVSNTNTVNFCFVFGCAPGAGVLAKTQLVKDMTEHLKNSPGKCIIPATFDHIESQDAGFETVASNMGQSLELVSLPETVGQITCIYVQHKKRTPDRDRQKAEAMRFCKDCLCMDDKDIVVVDNEELLWFHHNNWGDEPPMSQYKYSDLKSWQAYFKGEPLDITESQKAEVTRKMKALARRIFIEKKRFGTQWFQFSFMEGYRIDIQNKVMDQEFLEHGIYQIQQFFMQQSLDVIFTYHSQKASFEPYINTMKELQGERATGEIHCRADFFQYNNSNSNLCSFENTKPNLGHYDYILRNAKLLADRGEGIFRQSARTFAPEFVTMAKNPIKSFLISDLLALDQSRQILLTQITSQHSLCCYRVDKGEGKAVIGLKLNNKAFPFEEVDYKELDANFTTESFTLRKFFVSSDLQYALIGNINYAYKPGASVHHWETTIARISVKDDKLDAQVLPPIEIHDIYQLDVYPVASKDEQRVFMPYMMRGAGGSASGPESYTDDLYVQVFEYCLQTNQIREIQSRYSFQTLIKAAPHYMKVLYENGYDRNGEIAMRMAKGSIVQMRSYDSSHYVYYDQTDDWLANAELRFVFDWKCDDNGRFRMFTPQEIQSGSAMGMQYFPEQKFRSLISISMADSQSLSAMYYIDNTIITYSGQSGKRLTSLKPNLKIPTDATFYQLPGYHQTNFPFSLMEVASKGEVWMTNTNTQFKQLLFKIMKDHVDDKAGHYFFSYEKKTEQTKAQSRSAPSKLYNPDHPISINDIESICLNCMEQQKNSDGTEMKIYFNQLHLGPDVIDCLKKTGYMPPAHAAEFVNLMNDYAKQRGLQTRTSSNW